MYNTLVSSNERQKGRFVKHLEVRFALKEMKKNNFFFEDYPKVSFIIVEKEKS